MSETIYEQIKKRVRQEKRSKQGKEGSHCRYSDYTAPSPPLLESQYLDHLRLLDQFPLRMCNQYHSSITTENHNTQSSKEDHDTVIEIPQKI